MASCMYSISALHTRRDGNYEIYLMNADGSGQTSVPPNFL